MLELAIEFGVDPKTIQRIVNEQITLDRPVQSKKGGYNMITADLSIETGFDTQNHIKKGVVWKH